MSPDTNAAQSAPQSEEVQKAAAEQAVSDAELLNAERAAEEARARASAVVEGEAEAEPENPLAEASDTEIDDVFAGLS